jgi:hypothetical protein
MRYADALCWNGPLPGASGPLARRPQPALGRACQLGPRPRPHYWARLEERTYLVEPDGLMLLGLPYVTVEVPIPDRLRKLYLDTRVEGLESSLLLQSIGAELKLSEVYLDIASS